MTTSFKRQYLFLGLLLLTGLFIALSTLLGVDQRIGWIAAGFTIGVQVAIHMQRSAELRMTRVVRELGSDTGSTISESRGSILKLNTQTRDQSLVRSEARHPAGDVIQLNPAATANAQSVAAAGSSALCACACGCDLNANGGFEGLCSECRTSRLQESLACECDYASTSNCSCGVVTHWPASRVAAEADLVAVG